VLDGLRLAVGTFTVVPVRPPRAVDRRTAAAALAWGPAVGALLGLAAAVVTLPVRHAPLLAAALAVATLALLTRGLHLDGLADLADGLGSGRHRAEALEIMRRPDVGPFGVAALVLTLLVQVAALAACLAADRGVSALVLAGVTGRLAVVWACCRGVPAARAAGLGAAFAGSASPSVAAAWTAAALAASWAYHPPAGPVAVLAGLAAAALLLRHAVRRLGGVTGDVLGSVVEVTTTVVLVAAAVTAP
jgi:adenosylcobinamide-GDP ribazoletransferase